MRPSSPTLAAIAVLAMVALGLGLDRVLPADPVTPAGVGTAGPATSGTWYCAAGDTRGPSELTVLAATPPSEGTTPAEVAVSTFGDGVVSVGRRTQVFPAGTVVETVADGQGDLGVALRWWDHPVAVAREWQVAADAGVSGIVSGPCVAEPSERWIVPGVATAGGAQASLYLANPFDSDATVVVTMTTPDGVLAPRRLENVVVPRRSVRVIALNAHAPERADLGVVVETRAGRVIAEAVQSFNAAIGGVEGLSLAAAAPEPAETWTVPWFADAEQRESWLWLTNPGERAAAVEVVVHTDDGGTVPEGLEELIVEPGTVQRLDLRDLLPEGADEGAVTVRSDNGEPIVVSVATQFLAEDPVGTGITVELGAPRADRTWVLSGGATGGRDVAVHLANPSGEDAIVDLALWAGTGLLRPDELQGIRVPAGAAVMVELTDPLPEAANHTVFVSAREGTVVAGRGSLAREGDLDPVVTLGAPLGGFAGGGPVPPIHFRPGMTQRIGTELGPQLPDGTVPLLPEPDPTEQG